MKKLTKIIVTLTLLLTCQTYGMSTYEVKETTATEFSLEQIVGMYSRQIQMQAKWGAITSQKSLKNHNDFSQCDITHYEKGMTTMIGSTKNGDIHTRYMYEKLPMYCVVTKPDKSIICYLKVNNNMQLISKSSSPHPTSAPISEEKTNGTTDSSISSENIELSFVPAASTRAANLASVSAITSSQVALQNATTTLATGKFKESESKSNSKNNCLTALAAFFTDGGSRKA